MASDMVAAVKGSQKRFVDVELSGQVGPIRRRLRSMLAGGVTDLGLHADGAGDSSVSTGGGLCEDG